MPPPGSTLAPEVPEAPRGTEASGVLERYGRFVELPAQQRFALARDATRAGLVVVVSGLVLLEHRAGERCSAEVIGAGDVFDVGSAGHRLTTTATSLRPTRLYLLEQPLAELLGDLPDVGARLLTAAMSRQRRLDHLQNVLQVPRIENRLLLVLALVAERFGLVTHAGVRLDLRLTHRQLGWMASAQRPSVTTAMGLLKARGHIVQDREARFLIDPTAPLLRAAGLLGAQVDQLV